MKFTIKEDQDNIPAEKKILLQTVESEQIVGETTLEELENSLTHHKTLHKQYTDSVADLEKQVAEAKKTLQ